MHDSSVSCRFIFISFTAEEVLLNPLEGRERGGNGKEKQTRCGWEFQPFHQAGIRGMRGRRGWAQGGHRERAQPRAGSCQAEPGAPAAQGELRNKTSHPRDGHGSSLPSLPSLWVAVPSPGCPEAAGDTGTA